MFTMPDVKDITIPEAPPTDATKGLELVHVPPAIALVNVMDEPAHMMLPPTIGEGVRLTVTVLDTLPQLPVE